MNMKKIGIVTFHRAINYGAVLQTYALQEYLKKLNLNVSVIDYRSKYIEKTYDPFHIHQGKILQALIRGVFLGRSMQKKKAKFYQFVNERLDLTTAFRDPIQFKKINNEFDFIISGSDQVFSPVSSGFDIAYFLPYVDDRKKCTYAASFGVQNIDSEMIEEYRKRLSGFKMISLREESSANIVQQLNLKVETTVNIDPTFLLSKEDWSNLIGERKEKNKYVLLFNVEKPINDIAFAKDLAQKKGIKLIYINDRTIKKDKSIKYFSNQSIYEFLNLFYYADYIVTNSFHGTAFSIIFGKEFYVELNNNKQWNVRVENLLNTLGIHGRAIDNEPQEQLIEWSDVSKKISEEREKAQKYFCALFN